MDVMRWTVNEALRAAPHLVETFSRLGIDTCCGGTSTIREAADSVGLKPEKLRAVLEPVLGANDR
jgi:iron-sulfur cluster repair protein YtfE (RIC family)